MQMSEKLKEMELEIYLYKYFQRKQIRNGCNRTFHTLDRLDQRSKSRKIFFELHYT